MAVQEGYQLEFPPEDMDLGDDRILPSEADAMEITPQS